MPTTIKNSSNYKWLLLGTNSRYKVIAELAPADVEEYCYRRYSDNEHVFQLANGNYLVVATPPEIKPDHSYFSDTYDNLPGGTQGLI